MATNLSPTNDDKSSTFESLPTTPQDQTEVPNVPSDKDSSPDLDELITNAKKGKFMKCWQYLDSNPHLINTVPEWRAWGVLHQAVFWGKEEAILKALTYPECNPFVKTREDQKKNYGKDRTPDELTRNPNIKEIIINAQQRYVFTQDKRSPLLRNNYNYRTQDRLKMLELGGLLTEENGWNKAIEEYKTQPHLINRVDPITGLAILHEAVIANKSNFITELLEQPFTNVKIKTIDAPNRSYDVGKIPENVTESLDLISILGERVEKNNRLFLNLPVCTLPWKSDHLRLLFYQLINEYKGILNPNLQVVNQDKPLPLLLHEVFSHVNENDNWLLAKQEITYLFRNISYEYFQLLEGYSVLTEEKTRFFEKLVQIYTNEEEKAIYPELNNLFTSLLQANVQGNGHVWRRELGTYAVLLNALLMYWGIEKFTGTTYRAVTLSPQEKIDFVKDYEFTALNFMSCSRREDSPKFQKAEVRLAIDNSVDCAWSPRLIGQFADEKDETEYLYPCGARFRVTGSAPNKIEIKLLPQ